MSIIAFAGIDYSLTSPGLTFECNNELSCFAPFSTKDQKWLALSEEMAKHTTYVNSLVDPKSIEIDAFGSHEEREIFLADVFRYALGRMIRQYMITHLHIAIEGYSFGSKFSQAHKIGEAVGCLIAKISDLPGDCPTLPQIKFYRPSPQEVKKAVGGKIKDGKQGVYDKFVQETGIDLMEALDKKSLKSPISDLTDSWACYKWLKNKLDNQIQENINNGS